MRFLNHVSIQVDDTLMEAFQNLTDADHTRGAYREAVKSRSEVSSVTPKVTKGSSRDSYANRQDFRNLIDAVDRH